MVWSSGSLKLEYIFTRTKSTIMYKMDLKLDLRLEAASVTVLAAREQIV